MKKYKITLITSIAACFAVIIPGITLGVVSTKYKEHNSKISPFNTEYNGEKYIDLYRYNNELKQIFSKNNFDALSKKFGYYLSLDWLDALTKNDWNRDNEGNITDLYCSSESQALALYANCWGDFWSIELHQNKEPTDKEHLMQGQVCRGQTMKIRGSDYQYIENALKRASLPVNTVTYHGVEFMENEFYDQLQEYITGNEQDGYDYSNCVGKTITSYGFISTSLVQSYADSFFDWKPRPEVWPNEGIIPNPLKEPVLFKINIPKGYIGAAYLSNFGFAGFPTTSTEEQVLIDRNCKFKITNVLQNVKNSKDDLINIFEVDLLI